MEPLNELNDQDFIYSLAVPAGQAGSPLCFAARQSGLYVSEDGCRTWRSAYASLNLDVPLPTTCVAFSPGFAEDRMLFAGVPGGFLLSEDGGASWLSSQLPSPEPLPAALAISPDFSHDRLLLLGTSEDGVLRSTNRGSSWVAWNFGLIDFNILSLAFSPSFAQDQIVYAGASTGLFISHNGGRSWRDLPLPSGPAAVLSLALSPRFGEDGCVLAGTEGEGLFVSADRGKSWMRIAEKTLDGVINQLLFSETEPGILWAAHESALLRSQDGGNTWAQVLEGAIACLADPKGLIPGKLLVGMADGSVQVI